MSDTISPIGHRWEELERELYTPEEIAASDLRVALMGELVRARQETGISPEELETFRVLMEQDNANTPLDAVLKVLAPLGKTLAVVPLKTV